MEYILRESYPNIAVTTTCARGLKNSTRYLHCFFNTVDLKHLPDCHDSTIIILYLNPDQPENVNNTFCMIKFLIFMISI